MAVRVNTNVDALEAQRQLGLVSNDFSKAVQQLSSGLRINSAADDAAGLAISEKLKGQVSGFDQGGRNAQDAISMIQTGESALNTTQSMLQRMRELAVQASNDTYTNQDRQNIQAELNQLISEIDRIAQQTDFNTKKLLDGSAGGAQVIGGGPNVKGIIAEAGVAVNGLYTLTTPGTQQAIESVSATTTALTSTFTATSQITIQVGSTSALITEAVGDTIQEFINEVNTNTTISGAAFATLIGGQLVIAAKNNGSDSSTANNNLLSVYTSTGDFNAVYKFSNGTSALATAGVANLSAYAQGSIVGNAFSSISAQGGPATFSALEALGSSNTLYSTALIANSSVSLEAGNGVNYSFAVAANTITVTASDGSFTGTFNHTGGGAVTFNDFVNAVNGITVNGQSGSDPLHAAAVDANGNILAQGATTSVVGLILNNTGAGVRDAQHTGGAAPLFITAVGSGSFSFASGIGLNSLPVAANALETANAPLAGRVLTAADVASTSFLGVGSENALQTTSATRSALIAGGVAGGSVFTQTSSLTVTGGFGSETFTAQAGESMETLVQQVNGSGIGVTMSVDAGSGKLLITNNNFGGVDPTTQNGSTTGGTQVLDSPAAVAVSNATGDFTTGGLGINFQTSATSKPGQAFTVGVNQGSVDSSGVFRGGIAAVNATVTFTGPNGASTTMTATGPNSDQISGAGSMSGILLTLENPGNVTSGDSFTVVEHNPLQYQVGAQANQTIGLTIDAATSQALGVTSLTVLTQKDAETAITQLDRAIQATSANRSLMGAVINRLTNSLTNDQAAQENASAANSRIADVNVAQETVQFTRDQILLQAGTAVLAQANQSPTSILSLLR